MFNYTMFLYVVSDIYVESLVAKLSLSIEIEKSAYNADLLFYLIDLEMN